MARSTSLLVKLTVILSLVAIAAICWAGPAQAATRTWSGSTDSNWDTATNWDEGALGTNTPVFGAAGGSGTTLLNDMMAGNSVAGITFSDSAAAFTIDGNAIDLNGNITVGSGITTETINLPMFLTNNRTVTVESGVLTLGGVISSTRTLTKAGPGTVVLSGTNTYTGQTNVTGGTMILDGGAGGSLATAGVFLGSTYSGGTFVHDNTNATGDTSMTLPYVNFDRAKPDDNVLQVIRTSANKAIVTITDLKGQNIEGGHNINLVTTDLAGGGVNGTDYGIVVSDQTAYRFTGTKVYYNCSDFARYDDGPDDDYATAGDGFVRGVNYGVDVNTATSIAGTNVIAATGTYDQEITGSVTGQATATLGLSGSVLGTLKIVGDSDITLASDAQLIFENMGNSGVCGIIKTGGGSSTITASGTGKIDFQQVATYVRVDGAGDTLQVDAPIKLAAKSRFTKSGQGDLVLNGGIVGNNMYTTWINGGTLEMGGSATFTGLSDRSDISIAPGATFKWNSSAALTTPSGMIIQGEGNLEVANGTVTLTENNTYTGATTVGVGGTLQVGKGGATGSIGASSAVDIEGALVINRAGTDTVVGDLSGSGSITKSGPAKLILTGASTFTGSIVLDEGSLQLSPAGTKVMVLGAISRSAGTVANFDPGSGTIRTTMGNTNGIIGGWASFGADDWAVGSPDGSTLTTVTATTGYTNTSVALDDPANYAGNNMNVDSSQTPTGAISPNTLRFNLAAANTLTLQGTNTISSGGILVGTGVVNNLSKITGGTLNNASEMIVMQNNTANSLEIGSAITGGGAVVKFGAGTLVLSGTNSYSGQMMVNAGSLAVSSDDNLGGAGAVLVLNGGQLDTGAATFTIAHPISLTSGDGGVITNATGGVVTISGAITGTPSLIKRGGGTLHLSGTQSLGGALMMDYAGSAGDPDNTVALGAGDKLTTTGTSYVGDYKTAHYNNVTVSGAGAEWTNNGGRLYVGNGGSYNALTIDGGGQVTVNDELYVGSYGGANGNNNTVTVTGSGSKLIVSSNGNFQRGPNNNLVISDHGYASFGGQLTFGNAGKDPDDLSVTADSELLVASHFTFAQQCGNSTMILSGGSTMSNLKADLGVAKGTGSNTYTVDGSGTVWTSNDAVALNSKNCTMDITNGAVLTGTAFKVGNGYATDANNTVTVGSGSMLQAGASMAIGHDSSTDNTVTVNGGVLQLTSATPTITISAGSGNAVTMVGATLSYKGATGVDLNESSTANGVGQFQWFGNNALRLDGSDATGGYSFGGSAFMYDYTKLELMGTNTLADNIAISGANSGELVVSSSQTTMSGDLTMAGAAETTFVFTDPLLTNESKITGGGVLTLAGILNADFSGGTYDEGWTALLFDGTYSTATGVFASVAATGLGAGLTGKFDVSTMILTVGLDILPGDADENGVVNAADYMALKRHMGTRISATLAMGNFDGDTDVDFDDLQLLIGNYDASLSPASPVPEPATLFVLLAAGLPALLKRRRSRS